MSRIYEALQKAEAEKKTQESPPLQDVPVVGREMSNRDDMELPSRVQYQKLRVWLTNAAPRGERIQTVMVVSCRSGDGCTTTAALLAAALAEGKKKRVLIVDSNFRTPSLNVVFDVKNDGGFTELVSSDKPFEPRIQPTNRENLFVVTSGQIAYCPPDVFEGEPIDRLISEFKGKFDFIIFDAAPGCEFPDCYALAPKVDTIILVAQAERTNIEDAQRVKWNLEQAGGRLLGVVLNRELDYTPAFLRKFFRTAS